MIDIDALRWFKETFGAQLQAAVAPTPFSVDLLVAVAAQETGFIWVRNRNRLPLERLLEICAGDTLDENKGRKAFPRTHAQLLEQPRGDEMLAIGHAALVALSQHVPGYTAVAANPHKFCHGYGLFQYDLQFFLVDPDYFLERRWRTFSATLGKCLDELGAAARRLGLAHGHKLSDADSVAVAIAYNTGRFIPKRGLKQGYQSDDGRFYGENINDFLRMSKTVSTPKIAASLPAAAPGNAALPAPSPVSSRGDLFVVNVDESQLRVRREPKIDRKHPSGNVIAHLPDGHRVRRISGTATDKFLEIETSLNGALIRGFSATQFLVRERGALEIAVATPAAAPPDSGVVAVFAPRKPGQVTRRTALAGALSLNEPDRPDRSGTTPEALRQEIWDIVEYLAVDKPAHIRYQPRDGLTFCNIYAHDFCTLAGVYLPRCWWTADAIERLGRGEIVEPRLGATITEQRANQLFEWLRAFGLRFGWRQTGTLTRLQSEVNLGAIGLVIAKRKADGKPGHVTMVIPEREDFRARRDASGAVIAPLQSQAGARNFQSGTGAANWWNGEQFADSAFWLHN